MDGCYPHFSKTSFPRVFSETMSQKSEGVTLRTISTCSLHVVATSQEIFLRYHLL